MTGLESGSQLLGGSDLKVNTEAGLAGIESGQFVGAVADDGDTLGFQIFQGEP